MKEHRVTDTFTAPTQLKRIVTLPPGELARADLSSMRTLIANAAPVPYALKQEVIEKLGDGFLYEVYGSTELGVVTVLPPEDQLRKPGSCGKTYGPIEVRIVRDDGTERRRGSRASSSSARRSRWTATTTPTSGSREHGADWKSVGDVAYLDDEGYLFICDRKKDMIISGGVNIYPAEIEAVIHEHPRSSTPRCSASPTTSGASGCTRSCRPSPASTLDLDELRAFVDARVGGYKRPRDTRCATSCRAPSRASCSSACCATSSGADGETAV